MTGAEALKRACLEVREVKKAPPKKTVEQTRDPSRETREDRIVDESFRMVAPIVKGWIRARVREGSSVLESVAKLSRMLEAGGSIVSAASGIVSAIQSVRKVRGK
jgi:hypothetical protein